MQIPSMIRATVLFAVFVASALLLVAEPASAQMTGMVTDTTDAPLEGVVVEAWSDGARLASRVSGPDGRFTFPDSIARQTRQLRAGRLGYRLLIQPVESGRGDHHLRLDPEPVPLRGLVVETERQQCSFDDEGEARRLWNALSRRYSGPMDTVGIATYLTQVDTLLPRDDIGPLELPAAMLSQRGSSSQLRFSWTRRVRRQGYAFRVRRTERGRSFDSWAYAPLEADFAPHFVDPVFAELHRLRVSDRSDVGWTIEFCPRDPDDPSIRGSMRVRPDTTLLSVEWIFETPEPDEDAGGRAFFPPSRGSPHEAHALPTESMFWRRLPTDTFQEVHQRFDEWIVAQGDTVPFLPPRTR